MTNTTLIKLKATLIKWRSKVFSDLHSALIAVVLVSAISSISVITYYFNIIWLTIKPIMQTPTPLWLTLSLVLVAVMYPYLKNFTSHTKKLSNKKTRFFTTNKFKWRVDIYDDYFTVDESPFCKKHDVQFIFSSTKKYCPGTLNESCDNHLNDKDNFRVHEAVKSMIESKIRNDEEVC